MYCRFFLYQVRLFLILFAKLVHFLWFLLPSPSLPHIQGEKKATLKVLIKPNTNPFWIWLNICFVCSFFKVRDRLESWKSKFDSWIINTGTTWGLARNITSDSVSDLINHNQLLTKFVKCFTWKFWSCGTWTLL